MRYLETRLPGSLADFRSNKLERHQRNACAFGTLQVDATDLQARRPTPTSEQECMGSCEVRSTVLCIEMTFWVEPGVTGMEQCER